MGGGSAPQEFNDHLVAAGRGGGQADVDGLVIGVLTGLLDRSARYGVLAEIEAFGLDLL